VLVLRGTSSTSRRHSSCWPRGVKEIDDVASANVSSCTSFSTFITHHLFAKCLALEEDQEADAHQALAAAITWLVSGQHQPSHLRLYLNKIRNCQRNNKLALKVSLAKLVPSIETSWRPSIDHLLLQIATTAAGVAAGHGLSNMLFGGSGGGGGSSEPAPEAQSSSNAPAQWNEQGFSNNQARTGSATCEIQSKGE
jgi:hypothetical protein